MTTRSTRLAKSIWLALARLDAAEWERANRGGSRWYVEQQAETLRRCLARCGRRVDEVDRAAMRRPLAVTDRCCVACGDTPAPYLDKRAGWLCEKHQ